MLRKKLTLPAMRCVEDIYAQFSVLERWVFVGLATLLTISALGLAYQARVYVTEVVPAYGGSIVEGVVGAPRFINPVLAVSQTDKDLTQLVYAGLLGADTHGNLVPVLADSYEISDDALTYTFILKSDLSFHDGTPLTADDVAFTVRKALEPAIKSPERANWEGVTVEVVDTRTIRFTLSEPYAQFIKNMTLGILPQEHWGELTPDEFVFSQLNTAPIGSGPFEYISGKSSTSGIPEQASFARFDEYVLGKPLLKRITMRFYHNNEELTAAVRNGNVDTASEVTSGEELNTLAPPHYVRTATLPRIFAVFFNASHNTALQDEEVRTVLRDMVNVETLVETVLNGWAEPIDTPLLLQEVNEHAVILEAGDARARLAHAGYNDEEPLTITLTTANTGELKAVAAFIVETWRTAGVEAQIEVFEPGDLTQNVLRTRKYDALLFGEVVGTFPDPYAFWHSSQVPDPGLNLALYTDTRVDNLLVEARKTVQYDEREELFGEIVKQIVNDAPAVFLYAPHFMYVTSDWLQGVAFAPVMEPHERFTNVHLWHVNTKRIFSFHY